MVHSHRGLLFSQAHMVLVTRTSRVTPDTSCVPEHISESWIIVTVGLPPAADLAFIFSSIQLASHLLSIKAWSGGDAADLDRGG